MQHVCCEIETTITKLLPPGNLELDRVGVDTVAQADAEADVSCDNIRHEISVAADSLG